MNTIKRTERGWPGHFCHAPACIFRRNTLLESEDTKIVISTVGNYRGIDGPEPLTGNIWYETMSFMALQDGHYIDAIPSRELYFNSQWNIVAPSYKDLPKDVDNKANDMHEKVVEEFINKLQNKETL